MSDGTRSPRSLAYNAPPPGYFKTQRQDNTVTELDNQLRVCVERLLTVMEQKTALEQEEKSLKATLRERLPVGTKGTVNGHAVISIQPNRRFSADLAAETLPEALLALCMTTKVDSTLAKKNLPPATYDTLMVEAGEPKVSLL